MKSALSVSVIIPVRNEAATIRAVLEALFSQTRRPDEVVVVDGGSRDETVAFAAGMSGHAVGVRVIQTDHAYPGQARNVGARYASGPLLAFTDGGTVPEPDWLEKLIAAIEQQGADVAYGHIQPKAASFWERCIAQVMLPVPDQIDGQAFLGPSVANLCLTRNAWQRVGEFPPYRAGEDGLFNSRVRAAGLKIARVPSAIVHHDLESRPGAIFSKIAVYSRHNLLGGLWRLWHAGLLRFYSALFAMLIIFSWAGGFFEVPSKIMMAMDLAGVLALWGWRSARRMALHGGIQPGPRVSIAGIACVLLWLDLAALLGACIWFVKDVLRAAPERFPAPKILTVIGGS